MLVCLFKLAAILSTAGPGPLAQSITHLTADPGVKSLILHIHFPPSPDSRRVLLTYKRNYMHKVLVYRLVELR